MDTSRERTAKFTGYHNQGTPLSAYPNLRSLPSDAIHYLLSSLRRFPLSAIHYPLFTILLLWSLRLEAHPLTPIQVEPTFLENNRYQVEATFKIRELFVEDLPISEKAKNLPPDLDPRYVGFASQYIAGTSVWFDDTKVTPVISSVEIKDIPDETGLTAPVRALVIRYQGEHSPDAKSFSWSNEVQLGSYVLLLKRRAADKPEQEWLEAGQRSKGFFFTEAPKQAETQAAKAQPEASSGVSPWLIFVVLGLLGLGVWGYTRSRNKAR